MGARSITANNALGARYSTKGNTSSEPSEGDFTDKAAEPSQAEEGGTADASQDIASTESAGSAAAVRRAAKSVEAHRESGACNSKPAAPRWDEEAPKPF